MSTERMSDVIRQRVTSAARQLGTANPLGYVGPLIERSFDGPADAYADNALTPGGVPFEPSFSEREPDVLRFTLQPLGPQASPASRRDEATREMRRLVGPHFGRDLLRWCDAASEEWRGMTGMAQLSYGAWFGTAYDADGLAAAKIYYELTPGQIDALPHGLRQLVRHVRESIPSLRPVFTSIACRRELGVQRVTFVLRRALRLRELDPLFERLGLGAQLPALMRVVGLVLGGRFELPAGGALLAVGRTPRGPEVRIEVLLGEIPDLPDAFLTLLRLGMSERPRELQALARWLRAFTTEQVGSPGDFSVLSVRVTQYEAPRIGLYLRPVEFCLTESEATETVLSAA